jgi:hypothetical protein
MRTHSHPKQGRPFPGRFNFLPWRRKQEVPTKRFQKTSSNFDILYVCWQLWRVCSLRSNNLENRRAREKKVLDINCACFPLYFLFEPFSLPSISGELGSGMCAETYGGRPLIFPRICSKLLTRSQVLLRFLKIQFHELSACYVRSLLQMSVVTLHRLQTWLIHSVYGQTPQQNIFFIPAQKI